MSAKTDDFIKTISVLARNEYMSRDRWIIPSICIAQAALESGWNLEARTLFGIKGTGFIATTSEYYNDHYETIQDSFRAYPNVAASVVGYYDFLRDTPRYSGALNNTNYRDAVDKLIHTTDGLPYATDPTYISKIVSIIEQYNLTQYDSREAAATNNNNKSIDDLANEVIRGEWGNGSERVIRLNEKGYDAGAVQERVNELWNNSVPVNKPEKRTYTVQSGDSFCAIAEKCLGSETRYQEIKDLNNHPDDLIYPGDVLKIPN